MAEQQLALDLKKTALVLIDLQGAIAGRDTAPYKAADVITRCATLAEAVRSAGATVFYVHVLIGEFAQRITDESGPRPSGPIPQAAIDIVPEAGMKPATS